jgi:hypothetical protein
MKHLSTKVPGTVHETYPLAVFWPMVTNEILLVNYWADFSYDFALHASQVSSTNLGAPPTHAYQKYGNLLDNEIIVKPSVKQLLSLSVQQLAQMRNMFLFRGSIVNDQPRKSFWSEVIADLDGIAEENLLQYAVGEFNLACTAERLTSSMWDFLYVMGSLLSRRLCRLLLIALDAPSITQGCSSPAGVSAAKSFFGIFDRFKRFVKHQWLIFALDDLSIGDDIRDSNNFALKRRKFLITSILRLGLWHRRLIRQLTQSAMSSFWKRNKDIVELLVDAYEPDHASDHKLWLREQFEGINSEVSS